MNLFEAVKGAVSTKQAAENYGIAINRKSMAVCPFHNDKNPSMKVDKRFHCFGCQADGDVIDLVSRLHGVSSYEAAMKLAADFAISYDSRGRDPPRRKPVMPIKSIEQRYGEAESRCARVYYYYLRLLEKWKCDYAPQPDDVQWHPWFCEALEKGVYVEYLLDCLASPDVYVRASIVNAHGKEVIELERRVSKLSACNATGTNPNAGCNGAGNDSGANSGDAGDHSKGWHKEQSA